jgi:hypothetical protein
MPSGTTLVTKVIHNKKNNQLILTLPRKKLKLKKCKVPKKIKIDIWGFK